ncbi:hypothetical protein [Ornithinimicrobium panacihumi]|uniref:hypothetical protein n=1 Tax=Ornithinimicrobium panacihumi TaxID=2008449 RepID=UPI003F896268
MSQSRRSPRTQQVARWVRRTPGYQAAVTEVLPRLRRNAVLTDLVWRAFVPEDGLGARPVPLHPGRHLTGQDQAFLPVIGILALGLDPDQVEAIIEQIADLQRETLAFKPLLILDHPALGPARQHGFVAELLTPRARWADLPGGGDWLEHVGARVASIVHHYQVWHLARVCADGTALEPIDVALIRALPARLPERLDVRLAD